MDQIQWRTHITPILFSLHWKNVSLVLSSHTEPYMVRHLCIFNCSTLLSPVGHIGPLTRASWLSPALDWEQKVIMPLKWWLRHCGMPFLLAYVMRPLLIPLKGNWRLFFSNCHLFHLLPSNVGICMSVFFFFMICCCWFIVLLIFFCFYGLVLLSSPVKHFVHFCTLFYYSFLYY